MKNLITMGKYIFTLAAILAITLIAGCGSFDTDKTDDSNGNATEVSDGTEMNATMVSDTFPPSTDPPTVESILPSPVHKYYCSPTGNNTTGTGEIDTPWQDLIGAQGKLEPGDIVYFRGGLYPDYDYISNFSWANSQNRVSDAGTESQPIVFTNYPGEIALWSSSTSNSWSMTLYGDHQKLIGTKVGSEFGIQITGGISIRADHTRVSGVEFIRGAYNGGDGNPAMISTSVKSDNPGFTKITHNLFRDSKNLPDRMSCVRLFDNHDTTVAYNVFQNNNELSIGGALYLKDNTVNGNFYGNKFFNNVRDFTYVGQSEKTHGFDFHHNLSYGSTRFIYYVKSLGPDINIYSNVVLAVEDTIYFYYNSTGDTWGAGNLGEIYDNVFDGPSFRPGDHTYSSSNVNLPDLFDYNLYYDGDDRNCSTYWICDSAYYNNSIVSPDAVTYDSETMTATVNHDYAGIGKGRFGNTIGGFRFPTTD